MAGEWVSRDGVRDIVRRRQLRPGGLLCDCRSHLGILSVPESAVGRGDGGSGCCRDLRRRCVWLTLPGRIKRGS